MQVRLPTPSWGRVPTLVFALVCALVVPAAAQPKKGGGGGSTPVAVDKTPVADKGDSSGGSGSGKKGGKDKVKNFDFNALDLNGRMRTPQLLYFLERANEELERARLEKRSFIPHMVRSVEEEQL